MVKKGSLKFITALLLTVLTLVSCTQKPAETVTEKQSETEQTQQPDLPGSKYYDVITGMPSDEDNSEARAFAVVVKNDRSASPQYNLSKAAVLYESQIDGGLTRFLAVYSDVKKVDKIGPVIDARADMYGFANNHGAIVLQAGSSADAKKAAKEQSADVIDAVVGMLDPAFYRDKNLSILRGQDNSVLTSAQGVVSKAASYGFSLSSASVIKPFETVDYLKNRNMDGASNCSGLSIQFSANLTVEFAYQTSLDAYVRSQYNDMQTDAATGKPLSFTNLIVLSVSRCQSEDGEYLIQYGEGTGYYVYGGRYFEIIWKKANAEEPLKLYEKDGITPLKVAAGNVYTGILSDDVFGKISIK